MPLCWSTMTQIDHSSAPIHPGEQVLLDSLRAGPRSWRAIPAFQWINATSGNRLRGEVDTLLLIPTIGVLAIEVKAGIHSVTENGQWMGSIELSGRRSSRQLWPHINSAVCCQCMGTTCRYTHLSLSSG